MPVGRGAQATLRMKSLDVLEARFRANTSYELVSVQDLPPEQQALFQTTQEHQDFFGVLRPVAGEALTIKSVSRDTATLFSALHDPGPLPAELRSQLGNDCANAVGRLVMDGVLEIWSEDTFVSGVNAFSLLCDEDAAINANGRIARLSLEALRYAESIGVSDPRALARRLYRYNTHPASPEWRRRLPNEHSVIEFLGLERYGETAALFHEHATEGGANTPWIHWRVRGVGAPRSHQTHKLYVSPTIGDLPVALEAVADLAGSDGAWTIKVGRDVFGLLRPDKLMAYFDHFDALQEAAQRLTGKLEGMPAQGVPFTANAGLDGLLSWGIDPPANYGPPGWYGRESWRHWLSERLATAILAARHADVPAVAPYRFALERVRLDGVDPQSWTPVETIWMGDDGDH